VAASGIPPVLPLIRPQYSFVVKETRLQTVLVSLATDFIPIATYNNRIDDSLS
jgi:hypothetical protein